MKKLLIAFLLSLSCACMVAGAAACNNDSSSTEPNSSTESSVVTDSSSSSTELPDSSSSSTVDRTDLTVEFVEGEGFSFVTDIQENEQFSTGETVAFSLKISPFYTGYAVVSINNKPIAPKKDGSYEVTMTENIRVSVSGIQKEVSQMAGTGAFDDAFVVTRPVDLLYIAEQVNKGVYSYVTGAYVLAADIDCGGEELEIIGDLSTENSYFSGCFSCITNPDTGEMQRYKISNFVIHSDNANYVGLFGAVYADLSVTSSGLFYGIQLENFTINASLSQDAQVDNRSISAGGLIGYGIGANIWLCDAINGRVNIYGDNSYFSFTGGLIGYQQAFYSPDIGSYFPSEIVYSTADVDVRVLSGIGLYAGGISGYLATNYPYGATAFIHNSYATGNVSGALRSGGIAGGLGQYTSVSNSYATGNVSARATQSLNDLLVSDTQYCYAYAGGIVGYAENDTIVNDCFFGGLTSASSASQGCNLTGAAIAGGLQKGESGAAAQEYLVINCLAKDELNLSDTKFFTNTLGWGAHDWSFKKNAYPTIFYGSSSDNLSASWTIHYVSPNHDGVKITVEGADKYEDIFFDTMMESNNIYAPMGNYIYNGALSSRIQADNGYRLYGYYFDEACTQKVPYAYVPQKDIVLYAGFEDVTPILGTYQLVYRQSTNALEMTFTEDGIVTYTDGYAEQKAYFLYDGETITIQEARLARYYDGEIVIDENDTTSIQDPSFDMNRYSYYDFTGKLEDGVLSLYDGIYFTEENPLVSKTELLRGEYYIGDTIYKFYGDKAIVQNGANETEYDGYTVTETTVILGDTIINISDLKAFDEFKGTWTKSATVNKSYAFDGKGGWSYVYKSYTRNGLSYDEAIVEQASGSYQINDGVLTFMQNGVRYTAQFDDDGFLSIKNSAFTQTYYAEGSYVGTWRANGVTLELLGINASGVGKAIATYNDEVVYELVYERSETDGYVAIYYPHDEFIKDTLFGYFSYDVTTNTLSSVLTDPNSMTTGYAQNSLMILDDYVGEWICDADEFLNVEFRFDGNGLYEFLYGYVGMKGKLVLIENGVEQSVTYTLDSILEGKFEYKGRVYTMTYDEDEKAIKLNASGVEAELERKDVLANLPFIDMNGVKYSFDGRSNLKTGGILTVNGETEYRYTLNEDGSWTVHDASNGFIALQDNCYVLMLNGVVTELYLENEFMGDWAVGGMFGLLQVGPTDLNGKIAANFLGNKVEITQMEANLLTFRYKDGNMPIIYYVFIVEDEVLGYDVLVLSQYTNLYSGGYSICTKANDLYGTWTRNDGMYTLRFDGVTSGAYSNGIAGLSWKNSIYSTPYFYSVQKHGIMMWSQEVLGETTVYYKIEKVDILSEDVNASDVYVQRDENGNVIGAIRRIEVDSLYMVEAKDANDASIVYFFDGEGTLYAGEEAAYTYTITSFNTDDTAYLELSKDGNTYFAVLNYKDTSNITLTITLEESSENA